MDKILFSVIVPVYNVECYLRQCIDSILAQTYLDFEIILVDDGSQDSSGAICDEYAEGDSRIMVIHKKNQGQISARRVGLSNSSGQFVCFIDSDDEVCRDLLKKAADVIAMFSSDVITFKWKKIDNDGKLLGEESSIFPEGEIDKEMYFRKILSSTSLNSLCKKICRRSLFDLDADYSDYYTIRNGEDLLQSLPVVYRANKFYYLDEALYLYRMIPQSITHKYAGDEYKVLNVVRPALYQCMVKLGYDSVENREVFFKVYLLSIWKRLYNVCTNTGLNDAVLSAIYDYPLVVESRKYCRLADRGVRFDLRLFFSRHWRMMCFFFQLKNLIITNARRILQMFNLHKPSNE